MKHYQLNNPISKESPGTTWKSLSVETTVQLPSVNRILVKGPDFQGRQGQT
jgi:hypothetical protein